MLDALKLEVNNVLPLRDVVYHTLRDAILMGKIQPGERLMEVKLSKSMGVSRTPVREAIRMLEEEGLVDIVPRRGALVSPISEQSLKDLLQVRRALDILSAELACENMTENDIKALRHAYHVFSSAMTSEDYAEIADKDEAFHDIIYKATGNQKLCQVLDILKKNMYRYRLEYVKYQDRRAMVKEEHVEMIEALKNKDKDRVRELMKLHIDHQEETILKSLRRGE